MRLLNGAGALGGGGGGAGRARVMRGRSLALWCVVVLVLMLVLELGGSVVVQARKSRDGESDDGGEGRSIDGVVTPRQEWRKRRRKNSECRLGGQWHAINTTWSPNLGPPFGVWDCVQCICASVQKKRRHVARVVCSNVKNQCPEANCWNAVLLPGQCCKTCPPDDGAATAAAAMIRPDQMLQSDDLMQETESLTGNDFVVLLNGRTSQSPVTSPHVATGRLSIKRSTLHFSFLLSANMTAPESLQFLNVDGDVLEVLEAQTTPFVVNSNRVCGTWTRVPREYRQLLRAEGVWVALVPPSGADTDVLSGRLARYVGADTEVFSALLTHSSEKTTFSTLEPSTSVRSLGSLPGRGSRLPGGGTAIVSVDSRSESLHVSLIFNGIFPSFASNNTTMVLQLTPSRALPPVTETFVLEKVFTDINKAEVLTTLGDTSLPLLTRGRVHMKLWAESAPELAIEGTIAARATCNVFSSVLTASPQDGAEGERFGAGWAVVALTDEGFFNYQIQVEQMGRVTGVSLTAVYKRKKRLVRDLTDTFANGWANGTYTRPTYGELDALMRGRLQVTVEGDSPTIQGMLDVQAMTDALRSPIPALIRAVGVRWAATAWLAVDDECVMHYHVQLAGPTPHPSFQLVLQERDETYDPRLQQQRVVLEEAVDGWEVADHTTLLSQASLSRLHAGQVSLLEMMLFTSPNAANEPGVGITLITGTLAAMPVPDSCLLDNVDVDGERKRPAGCGMDCLNTADEDRPRRTKCIDRDKRVYEDGASWRFPWSKCEQCMCTRGTIKCVPEVCPEVKCDHPTLPPPPDQCCRICPGSGDVRRFGEPGCFFSNQSHPVGSQWHPFLPPNGFDRCVTCSCRLDGDRRPQLQCARVECPTLLCPTSESVLPEGSCCRVCREPSGPLRPRLSSPMPGVLSEDNLLDREKEREARLLANGGCHIKGVVREDGEEWHPRMSPGGVSKCIKCLCKDGELSCRRLSCPQLSCPRKVLPSDSCCAQCDGTTTITGTGRPTSRPGKDKLKGGKRTKQRKNRNNDMGRRG